jgi:restriction system protein
MIENPNPIGWRDLQAGVCRIFNEIGLNAEVGKHFETPRGNVEADVFAIDENSVDKIKYLVECKNWNQSIPQTVIHAFTTVMHEIGGNIGFVISKQGLQSGAESYTQNTNISGFTYEQFQDRYFGVWYKQLFIPKIGDSVDTLAQYVEPFNSYRDKRIDRLSDPSKRRYLELLEKYGRFGISMAFFEYPRFSNRFDMLPPGNIESIKKLVLDSSDSLINLEAYYFRDLLFELVGQIMSVTNQFNEIFGEDIFAQQ